MPSRVSWRTGLPTSAAVSISCSAPKTRKRECRPSARNVPRIGRENDERLPQMKAIYFDKNIPRFLATKALRPIWPGVIWSPISPSCVEQIPDPPLPGPRWLRVRDRQCGICATDLSLLHVKADPRIAPAVLPGIRRIYLWDEDVWELAEV